MGVSRMTAYEIYGNPKDIVCDASGPDSNEKFIGWITRGPGHNYKPLLSTRPTFASRKEAIQAMEVLVKAIKSVVAKEFKDKKDILSQIYPEKK